MRAVCREKHLKREGIGFPFSAKRCLDDAAEQSLGRFLGEQCFLALAQKIIAQQGCLRRYAGPVKSLKNVQSASHFYQFE